MVKAMFAEHGPDAIAELVRLLQHSEDEMVRVACAKEILNRAYGKAIQPLAHDPDEAARAQRPIIVMIRTSESDTAPPPRVTVDAG